MNSASNRKSNIECLRVLSMFLIVCMHLLWHGNVLAECDYGSVSYYLFWTIRALCYTSVNSFVLISGYFMVYSRLSAKKLIRILIQTLFYSIVMYGFVLYLDQDVLSVSNILKVLTPVSSGQYWYITSYVLMCIFSPILNLAVNRMNRISHLAVIISHLLFFCIIPTFLFWTRNTLSMGRDLPWFLTLYLVAAFIRKYNIRYNNRKLLLCYLVSILLMLLSLIVIGSLTHSFLGAEREQDLMLCFNSIFSFVASISTFIFFLNINIHSIKLSCAINSISMLVLGVYMFHENPFFRPILWGFLKPARFLHQDFGIVLTLLYSFLLCIAIMLIGCMIEKVRLSLYSVLGFAGLVSRIEKQFLQLLCMFDKRIGEQSLGSSESERIE